MVHETAAATPDRVRLATKLLHCKVKDARNEEIGKIEDLIVATSQGRVAYAVLSFGGFLGAGEKLFAIPFAKVVRTADASAVVADFAKTQLENAPAFAADSWPSFDRDYDQALHDHYKVSPHRDDASRGVRQETHPVGTDATRITKNAIDRRELFARGMCRVSEVIGTGVEDATGKRLGEVNDLTVDDRTGRIVYAVLSFGGFLGMGDKLFAIPWRALKGSSRGGARFVLDVPKERLEAAPGFDKKSWPDLADRRWGGDIHKYYDQKPYWTSDEETGESVAVGGGGNS